MPTGDPPARLSPPADSSAGKAGDAWPYAIGGPPVANAIVAANTTVTADTSLAADGTVAVRGIAMGG